MFAACPSITSNATKEKICAICFIESEQELQTNQPSVDTGAHRAVRGNMVEEMSFEQDAHVGPNRKIHARDDLPNIASAIAEICFLETNQGHDPRLEHVIGFNVKRRSVDGPRHDIMHVV